MNMRSSTTRPALTHRPSQARATRQIAPAAAQAASGVGDKVGRLQEMVVERRRERAKCSVQLASRVHEAARNLRRSSRAEVRAAATSNRWATKK